ncbi:MAG: DUF1801 domain-containing protein [Deltaproteobacteria bacterium]|nr:DUF1801 domain-containing protein [Deltaproteobacteria bacterium]
MLIQQAVPTVVEERKWKKPSNPAGAPTWSEHGIICTGERYKDKVKLTFAQGAALEDPSGLFNAGFGGNTRRAIDISEGVALDEAAFKQLVRGAAALNVSAKSTKNTKSAKSAKSAAPRRASAKTSGAAASSEQRSDSEPKRLSGGNPQIPKGDGDAPVQAYIAAMPAWQREIGHRLDTLIEALVPKIRKAVRWNSPFYGVEGKGWFLSYHVFTKYLKVTFFRGAALRPHPPGESKQQDVRYLDIHAGEKLDEERMKSWILQASKRPGAPLF